MRDTAALVQYLVVIEFSQFIVSKDNTRYLEAVSDSTRDNADGVETTKRGLWPPASLRRVVQFSEQSFANEKQAQKNA